MGTMSVIGGRYRVEGRLGVGGMSTVLLALDERLERHVAVKLLAEHLADDPTFVSRFRREALAAARLVHPNIVQVFDSGFDQSAHQHYIVMEYVPGQSCAELLRDRGHLDIDQVIEIVEQACRGLDYAHRHGVIHRDVKPGNLLVSDSEIIKLADFGIARATGQSSITQVGSVLGTAAYLSPEQARGEGAGPAADLYSLGVVAYQLLTGRLPYEANSLSELALKQQRESPIPLRRLNQDVPETLAEAIALTISVAPEERPQSARSLAELIIAGANGVSPYSDDAPTRHLGSNEAATRVLRPHQDDHTAETTVMGRVPAPALGPARTPRTVPARRPDPEPERSPRRAQKNRDLDYDRDSERGRGDDRGRHAGRQRARRLGFLFAFLLVLVVAAIVIVVLLNQSNQTVVHDQQIVTNDLGDAINQVQQIINKYTSKG